MTISRLLDSNRDSRTAYPLKDALVSVASSGPNSKQRRFYIRRADCDLESVRNPGYLERDPSVECSTLTVPSRRLRRFLVLNEMASDTRPHKPRRIARIQIIAVSTLSITGVINYIDRGSLAIANTTIRTDLGISATRMGILLSIFSLSYAFSQLPMGFLLDRLGERLVLGAGMFLWSLTQTATGLVTSFSSFVGARVGLAVGESPFVVSAVKAVNDWFDVRGDCQRFNHSGTGHRAASSHDHHVGVWMAGDVRADWYPRFDPFDCVVRVLSRARRCLLERK
jgi:hypothetical protein